MKDKLKRAIKYYDTFAKVYDMFSPKWYYHKAKKNAIEQLSLEQGNLVINLPCGTGQNFEYIEAYLKGTGMVVGIDLSEGMLEKAKGKVADNNWKNIKLFHADARHIDNEWLNDHVQDSENVDAILCDLGLSGFPNWKQIIDNLFDMLKPTGRLVIMDWYIPKPTLRGKFIRWIGKGEVDRPIYQYLEQKVYDFSVNASFNRGGVFVATAIKS